MGGTSAVGTMTDAVGITQPGLEKAPPHVRRAPPIVAALDVHEGESARAEREDYRKELVSC